MGPIFFDTFFLCDLQLVNGERNDLVFLLQDWLSKQKLVLAVAILNVSIAIIFLKLLT